MISAFFLPGKFPNNISMIIGLLHAHFAGMKNAIQPVQIMSSFTEMFRENSDMFRAMKGDLRIQFSLTCLNRRLVLSAVQWGIQSQVLNGTF